MALIKVNPDNARVWGSDDDFFAVAEIGADFTAPSSIAAAAPQPFVEAGWIHPDGFSLTPTDEVAKLKGFQGGRIIRTVVTSSETSIKVQCLESTLLTLGLALGMKGSVKTGGVTKHTLPGGRTTDKRQGLIGLFDGSRKWLMRFDFEVGEKEEIKLGKEEITGYNLTLEIIGDITLYTEGDPGMEPVGS